MQHAPARYVRSLGFPYTSAPTPMGVDPPPKVDRLGDSYDTEWARHPLARWSRRAALDTVGRAVTQATCRPRVVNSDRLGSLEGPAVFVANHHSHLDTTLLLTTLPRPWRNELVVAAAADYFFDTRLTATLAAWAYGAVPMERRKVSRRSADRAAGLLDAGWSLLIFPEGGRSPDGYGQQHKGGAAYLGVRCGAPIVPVHLEGTGRILPKGSSRPQPGEVTVNIGAPLHAARGRGRAVTRGPGRGGAGGTGRRDVERLVERPPAGPRRGDPVAAGARDRLAGAGTGAPPTTIAAATRPHAGRTELLAQRQRSARSALQNTV